MILKRFLCSKDVALQVDKWDHLTSHTWLKTRTNCSVRLGFFISSRDWKVWDVWVCLFVCFFFFFLVPYSSSCNNYIHDATRCCHLIILESESSKLPSYKIEKSNLIRSVWQNDLNPTLMRWQHLVASCKQLL